jgi:hypothetical protein
MVLNNNSTYCAQSYVTLEINKNDPDIIIIFICIWLECQRDLNCDFKSVNSKTLYGEQKRILISTIQTFENK